MALAQCPLCTQGIEIPDALLFGLLQCAQCQKPFKFQVADLPPVSVPLSPQQIPSSAAVLLGILAEPTRSPAATSAPAEPARPPGPAMIQPHICQHCWFQMTTPINKKAATINCPRCKNKTSVYAVQFKCPNCRETLECPKRLTGEGRQCPCCQKALNIPKFVLDTESDGHEDLEAFLCKCPSCAGRVVARRDEVGRPAVCPLCLVIITVPSHGIAAHAAPKAPIEEDPRETQAVERKIACRGCGLHIPADAESCPICGRANRASPYPS